MTKIKVLFKGGCLRYDAVDKILIATPFKNLNYLGLNFKGHTSCWNTGDAFVIALPIGILAGVSSLFIVDYFDLWISYKHLRWFMNIFAGGDVDSDRNQDVSVQEDGESIPLREIADNHNNRGNEAQDEEDSSFE